MSGADRSITDAQRGTLHKEPSPTLQIVATGAETGTGEVMPALSKNVALSLFRVLINTIVALVLPSYLAHHLQVQKYGAWALILQLSATVAVLDLGLQTGIAKFISEHHAQGKRTLASKYASSGFVLMLIGSVLGLILTVVLSVNVPRLFHDMPQLLYRDVRLSILFIGSSVAFNLGCSIFAGVFLGLQRYTVPMLLAAVDKVLFAAVVVLSLQFNSSLAAMGAAVAAVHVGTGILQIVLWRRMASHISVTWDLVDPEQVKTILRYCFLMGLWSIGMLCVNGLDLTIVGRYDFNQTSFYSVAAQPTNFIITVLSATLAPLLPAASALSTYRPASEMGRVLAKTMKYSTTLLFLTGLPLIVYGDVALRLWVGPFYAAHCLTYLRLLVLGNMIRILCAPYATMVVGVGKVWQATGAPIVEAVLNLVLSFYLAQKLGAIGVAYGTIAGSIASVAMHFFVSMRYTQDKLAVRRSRLLLDGILRPSLVAIPSAVLAVLIAFSNEQAVLRNPFLAAGWLACTLLFAYLGTLNKDERRSLLHFVVGKLRPGLRPSTT